jgi:hypothetical protein
MTIERLGGRMQITCDTCPASQRDSYGKDEFHVMTQDAKAEGWHFEKKHDGWDHFCPGCVEAARPQRRMF